MISFSKSAINDLKNIKEYYLEHVETLSLHPDLGLVVSEFSDESIRELIHSPFRVVYLREIKTIKVIRVWRSERLLKLPENK